MKTFTPNASTRLSSADRFSLKKLSLAAALGVSLLASPAIAEDKATLESLSKKMDNMQATFNSRVAKLEKEIADIKKNGADPEAAAKNAFREIHGLVGNNEFAEAKKKLAAFNKEYADSQLRPHAERLKMELDVVGKKAPADWSIEKWLQGEDKIDLDSKKPTLVVFWELWCPHCQREVPKIQKMYDKLSPEGLQIVALTKMSRGKTEKEIMDFLGSQNVSYPAAKEAGKISEYFAVSGIPAAVFMKDGKVAWRGHPARLTEDMIKAWL